MNTNETLEIHVLDKRADIDDQWQPVVGDQMTDFLSHAVPEESRDEIRSTAVSILSRGVSPSSTTGRETGLVVGYVQSGKTLHFEATAALACDNGFQMVVILAGKSKLLLEQSTVRVHQDLQIENSNRPRKWIRLKNPTAEIPTRQILRNVFADWRDEDSPIKFKETVLVTVLKHHLHLRNLTELVSSVDMDNVPVLIIDDEADQVSLNAEVKHGDESTTYRRLMELRNALPLHNYLQYTATPQAPLLISIADSLSPNFVEILKPGPDYVGGLDFFTESQDFVRIIPNSDVRPSDIPLTEPPDSLLAALRFFMVGVSIGLIVDHNRGNRSMLIHPSHLTEQHREYFDSVYRIVESWKSILDLPDEDPDKQDLLQEFREAYDDLSTTIDDGLPNFEEISASFRYAFRRTRLLEVNSSEGETPQVDWGNAYGWILVGGQALDRGFTIEGLTVTYMPRSVGGGNADTIQQRARFLGYKRKYLGFCRVYLEQNTYEAFSHYVEHEEYMRRQLEEIRDSGRSLNDWKRSFILDLALRPCRDNVVTFGYMRGGFSDGWVTPLMIEESDFVLEANRETVADFLSKFDLEVDTSDPSGLFGHEIAKDLLLRDVVSEIFIPMRVTSSKDSLRKIGLSLQLSRAIEQDPSEKCTVYRMSPAIHRERTIDDSGAVGAMPQLFQGPGATGPLAKNGVSYPGDRYFKEQTQVTFQIHTLNLKRDGSIVRSNVPVLAIWVPARLAEGWINQHQPGQD